MQQQLKYIRGGYHKTKILAMISLISIIILIICSFSGQKDDSYKASENSFFRKLSNGVDVNILIIGDSIGAGAGASESSFNWISLLEKSIKSKYKSKVFVTNISMGGNTSYAGYVCTMALDDEINYDLAIICYGQNDETEKFSLYYESIIRAVRNKYRNCSIISILESSQREYTEKMETIKSLANHYGILVADTINPFMEDYDSYTNDGVHPNNRGQSVYAESVEKIIDLAVLQADRYDNKEISIVNDDVKKFDMFHWIDSVKFERLDDITFILKSPFKGILGIDYSIQSGDNTCDINVDRKLFESQTVCFNYEFSQRYIVMISECEVDSELKLIFGNKKQADGFYGICFSNSL